MCPDKRIITVWNNGVDIRMRCSLGPYGVFVSGYDRYLVWSYESRPLPCEQTKHLYKDSHQSMSLHTQTKDTHCYIKA